MPRKTTARPAPAPEPPKPARPEKLALNLWDVTRLHPTVAAMLAGRVDRRKEALVWVDRTDVEETAVVLTPPLLEAACLVDVVRAGAAKIGDKVPRAYVFRKTWARLPATAVLTTVRDGKPALAPEWFAGVETPIEAVEYVPPPAKPVRF